MAETLTWRDVAAPDLGNPINGMYMAGGLFGDVGDRMSNALQRFRDNQQHANDQAAMLRASTYTDPTAYQQALSNGSILGGVNGEGMSLDGMRSILARTGALQQNQQNQNELNDRANLDAASPTLNAASQRYAAGDIQGAQSLLANDPAVSRVNPAALQRLMSSGISGNNENQAAQLNNTIRNRALQEDIDNKAVDSQYSNDLAQYPDKASFAANLDAATANMSAAQKMRYRNLASRDFPDLVKPLNIDLNPGVSPSTVLPINFDQTFGGNGSHISSQFKDANGNVNLTGKSFGQVSDIGADQIKNTKGLLGDPSVGTSALGGYQLTDPFIKTYAPKVLGSNYQNLPFSPENQRKVAQAGFEANKNGDLSKIWANPLVSKVPGFYKNMTFDQFESTLTDGEGTTQSVPQIQAGLIGNQAEAARALTDIQQRRNLVSKQQDPYGMLPSVQSYEANGDSEAGVVNQLIKEHGLSSSDAPTVLGALRDLHSRFPKLSFGQVAAGVSNNIGESGILSNTLSRLPGTTYTFRNSGKLIDRANAEATLQKMQTPEYQSALSNYTNSQNQLKVLSAAKQASDDSATQLQTVLAQARNNPRYKNAVKTAYSNYAAAFSKYNNMASQIRGSSNFTPNYNAPALIDFSAPTPAPVTPTAPSAPPANSAQAQINRVLARRALLNN